MQPTTDKHKQTPLFQITLVALLITVLAGCVATPQKADSVASPLRDTSALILFRTVNKAPTSMKEVSGFVVILENADTGETFRNSAGMWGFPGETDYRFWGRYHLTGPHLRRGRAPETGSFQVEVAAGEVVYIGTLSTSAHFPRTGFVARARKIYARKDCLFPGAEKSEPKSFSFVTTKVPGLSRNSTGHTRPTGSDPLLR